MKIVKYAQSTIKIECRSGLNILIDPGKYNYRENFKIQDFGKIDVLIITHKHADHHDIDAEKRIYELWKPKIYTSMDIAKNEGNVLPYKGQCPGDRILIDNVEIFFVNTDHFVKGEKVDAIGVVVKEGSRRVYHTSDTRFMDSSMYDLNIVKGCDVLFVPISNRGVVMGIDDSIFFTFQIQPKIVIPMHYDSPKDISRIKPEDFVNRFEIMKNRMMELKYIDVKILGFKDSIVI